MSNRNGDVCGIDEARHGDSVQRLGGVTIAAEASVVVVAAAADVWSPDHRDTVHVSSMVGGVAAVAGTSIGDAEVVAGNGGFDGGRKELRPRLSWTGSNLPGVIGKMEKHTQRTQMWLPREQEDPEQKGDHQRQENGRKS